MARELGFEDVLLGFKTLGDETRLKIIGLLNQEPHTVGELAQALELTEPTISHHLARLREIGMVNLKASGTRRIYRLNTDTLARWKEQVTRLETLYPQPAPEKQAGNWINDLPNLDDWERKVLKDYFAGQRLKQIPTKHKKLLVVLRWLVTLFEPGRMYTENDVNTILKAVHEDYASLRRELVESGLLGREGGGGLYWRA